MNRRRVLSVLIFPLGCSGAAAPAAGRPEAALQVASPKAVAGDVPVVVVPAETGDGKVEVAEVEVAPSTSGGGWPLFHGNAARTGLSDAPPITNPVVFWKARVGIQGWLNSPVVAGEIVIVPSSGNKHNSSDPRDGVFAIHLRTGRTLWQARFGNDANGAAAATDRIVATSDDGHVYALELQSGKVLWKRPGDGKVYTSPLVLGDRVIAGDSGGNLMALSLQDGTPLWKLQLSGAVRGGASSDGTRIYAVSQDGEAVAVRLDGSEVWRSAVTYPGFNRGKPTPIEGYAAPIVTQNAVIIPFARDTYFDSPALVALDKASGKVVWMAPKTGKDDWGNIRSTPALSSRGVLVYSEPYSGDVAGIDARTGSVVFRRTIGPCFFPQYASAAIARDVAYVPRFDGAVYAIEAHTGKPLWQFYLGAEQQAGSALPKAHQTQNGCEWEVPSGHPLYAPAAIAEDGTLLVGSGEGILYAIVDASKR
jgi:outer membrane protein assembly factor BamB